MAHVPAPDDVLDVLASARPFPPAGLVSPDSPDAVALLDRLVAGEVVAPPSPRRPGAGVAVSVAVAAVAAVVVAALVAAALLSDAPDRGRVAGPHSSPPAVLAAGDIRRIADVSAARLGGSGRARTTYVLDEGQVTEERGTVDVAFAGDDLEMLIQVEGRRGRPGFDAANRTVGGEFYLLDGPPGAERWYHDTNAAGTRGSDLFSLDPRTLLAVVQPEGGFVEVGTEQLDGTTVRHLRATELDDLPALNLSLGPIDPASVTALDVWADGDGVVRRLDLSTRSVETVPAGPLTATVVDENGKKTKVTIVDPAAGTAGTVTREHRGSYSVRFHDIGAPISIVAPPGAIAVAGQG